MPHILREDVEYVAIRYERLVQEHVGNRLVRFREIPPPRHAAGCTVSSGCRIDENRGSRGYRSQSHTANIPVGAAKQGTVRLGSKRKGPLWFVVIVGSTLPAAAGPRSTPP